jgi:hypothetical protein
MRHSLAFAAALASVFYPATAQTIKVAPFRAKDGLHLVISAADRSTLDQKKTHPFHLRAKVAPSLERDKDSGRTGEIEIWWKGPGVNRRELRSAVFHQVEIVDGGRVWQLDEGDYMPSWLDGLADAFLHPLPGAAFARHGIAPDLGKSMFGSVYLNWEKPVPMDMQPSKEVVAVTQGTGLLFYDFGVGWGALFKDYQEFHGRSVPRTVSSGSPEATAKVEVLEDLPPVAGNWFEVSQQTPSSPSLQFVEVGQTNLAKDVAGGAPPLNWPEIPNTGATAVIWTDLVLHREGHIREPFSTISDNPALNGFMHDYLSKLQFNPVLMDGQPVQVARDIVLHFNLGQPAKLDQLLPTNGPA